MASPCTRIAFASTALVIMVVVSGCDATSSRSDGGGDRLDASGLQLVCDTDAYCADGRFCNGEERCDPEAPGADARGCLLGDDPCPGQRCEEETASCSSCDVADADGDGHADIGCGGDDCDDGDPLRFPGAVEVCDPLDRDEDCDPSSVGTDADGDGAAPAECCNEFPGGLRCGADCNDANPLINPDALEVCNGVDEDCDGTLDEGVPHTIFPDDDGDGFGRTRDGISSCTLPSSGGFSFVGGDCDDDDGARNPANAEDCNDVDDDCDSAVDEGCPCEPGAARTCGLAAAAGGFEEQGVCHPGDQVCRERRWSSCIMASVPEEERCNRVDDDCDGDIDEGQTVLLFPDGDGDGFGDRTEPRLVCGTLAGFISVGGDCDDSASSVFPGGVETCDGTDEDCDASIDEGLVPACGTSCVEDATRPCSTACGSGVETCAGGEFAGCTAQVPVAETCNGMDDDCNGTADNGVADRACSTSCGSGTEMCVGGFFVGCTAPTPMIELCNDIDDDCNGTPDDGIAPRVCSTVCGSGLETCTAGVFGGCDAPADCDLTPAMTGPTAPSGIVTASGSISASYPGWQAFDGNTSAFWLSETFVDPAWLAYEFTDGPRTVLRYRIQYNNGGLTSRAPRDWEFQGSNDGSAWDTLDTQAGQTGWTGGEIRSFTLAVPAAYTHYRLFVTFDNDARVEPIVTVHIAELYLEGY